jgi:hypothetical protein
MVEMELLPPTEKLVLLELQTLAVAAAVVLTALVIYPAAQAALA